MKHKKYTLHFLLTVLLGSFSSCNKWLELKATGHGIVDGAA
jgi:hypothetical protein